jgi:hypothetical protein
LSVEGGDDRGGGSALEFVATGGPKGSRSIFVFLIGGRSVRMIRFDGNVGGRAFFGPWFV